MLSRRDFFYSTLALYAAWPTRRLFAGAVRQNPRFTTSPFTLGIASGDPSATGVVLWTRLALDPLHGGGMPPEPVEVEWRIAADDRMSRIVKSGKSVAAGAWGHSVHVEVDGLSPHTWYWYQFRAGNELSAVGRTRTFPAARTDVERARFGFVSCQHYEQGLYTALEHMAREDLDFAVHLGDYIYENPGGPNRVRQHVGGELMTLEDYRNRYAQYKSDPALQAVHAAFPWIVVWDDHEVDNNYAGFTSERDDPVEEFAKRRAAGYQAYYEHMPLRRASIPRGPLMQVYRPFAYGNLANLFMLDTRQFRTDQPCGDNVKPPCPGMYDPKATLLGPTQEKWLIDGLSHSSSRWNLLAQQIMMARLDRVPGADVGLSMDKWDGYDVERARLLKFFDEKRPSNPIVLAGDIHNNWVNDLHLDAADVSSPMVATEFVGTSVSTTGDGIDITDAQKAMVAENPWVRFCNNQRGYVTCDVARNIFKTNYRVVDFVTRPGAPVNTRASFVVESGQAGAKRE
ncbi:MAG TPA: alkaline phosphatase D family protein [Vicinamibacterales bacterium]|nr:alkaline phosphatase D family protein [Vicinamibacterales bacterium]